MLADGISLCERAEDQERISSLAAVTLPDNRADMEKFLTETIRTLKTQQLEQSLRVQEDLALLQAVIKQKKMLQDLWINLPGYGKG